MRTTARTNTATAGQLALLPQAPSSIGHVFADQQVLLDEQMTVLAERIETAFLSEAGWDPVSWVLRLPVEHPLLGRLTCQAPGCQTTCHERRSICLDCRRRLTQAGLSLEDAGSLPPPRGRRWLGPGDGRCTVAGCPRPWTKSEQPLCPEHLGRQRRLGVDVATFAARPDVTALPSHGICAVAACLRQLPAHDDVYCDAHLQRLRCLRRAGQSLNEQSWRLTESPIARAGQVSLAGIRPGVVVQVLFGLQQRTRQGVKTNDAILRSICMDVRRQQVSSLAGYAVPAERGISCRSIVNTMITHVRRGLASTETEIARDAWDMALFGHRGLLSFTAITQPWLRETAKVWALADLPRRRGRSGGDKTRHYLSSLALLSDSLRHRPDHGQNPAALGRADIEMFLNRLAYLESAETISPLTRLLACREVRKLLTTARQLGATKAGGQAAGLSDQFALHRDDIPAEPEHGEPGRDLPLEIMRQLCGHFGALTSPQVRTGIEILIDTGRRPEDVVGLPWDCLTHDGDGSPVLVYDNHKASRQGRRLPIPTTTAQAIRAQQQRVRDRFPGIPLGELKLLPTGWANRHGRRTLTVSALAAVHREWVNALPPLLLADGTEYDKDRIIPYAYRHTYAQRHADAGVAIDVLAELLDHRNLNVTRRYYRVGEERRRDAVDKVTAMQFDRHGNRIWRDAQARMDAEHARYAIGSVAVPYGTCTEPSNVQAGGDACPVRFRCAGCDHFRTDASYLPDLTAYLDDLLRTRERLAAIDGVDEWARAAAIPAEEEITRIRRLINRVKGDIAGLPADERARINEAVTVIRKHRAVNLGMPTVRATRPTLEHEALA